MVTTSASGELEYRDLLSGLVRMHILFHAVQEEVYGLWLIDELSTHGYRLSAGTLYPMLHGMARERVQIFAEKGTGK